MPPELWLTVLENTAKAPWLNLVSQEHEQKLKRAYTLLYQIVLYLGRPQEEGKAEQFLVVSGPSSYISFGWLLIVCVRLSSRQSFLQTQKSGVPGEP
jgi:hypothetical protein